MTKPVINQLGSIGLMADADPTMVPDAAFTDVLNVRFNGREIEPCLGNQAEPYYLKTTSGAAYGAVPMLMEHIIFDGFSNGASLMVYLTRHTKDDDTSKWVTNAATQNMATPTCATMTTFNDWPIESPWLYYKGQVNNCPFFGSMNHKPMGKQYDWTGFDALPGWGEQTDGTQTTAARRWTCRKIVMFDNRLLMLNTIEESAGGVDIPYPSRVRWSGFAQENAFPINWDDTAANRTPEEFAAAVIDGYAGWQDLSDTSQMVDACTMGGTLFVYSERQTFSLTPSGNDQAPFITKLLYSDLGCLDIGCAVNAKGYNYVFTGSDVIRHDNVSWKSIADGACREYLAELVGNASPGMVRMLSYPELNEIWVMCRGSDQADGDYAKVMALTYNYINGTWSKRSLPYIYDATFAPLPPSSDLIPKQWDQNTGTWDAETALWDNSSRRISQGVMIGSCAASPSIYYLNTGYKESRHIYSSDTWKMQEQSLQCYVERRGLEFGVGQRFMIQATYLNGKGTDPLTVKVGRADNPDGGYTWDSQDIASLATQRRQTWRAEGEVHGYRLEIAGRGAIPVGISFTTVSTGNAY